ncbi:MAG: FecR family protein [Chlorobi bacterium]|nr:FecR family protein [Chlorobiota bacterium]
MLYKENHIIQNLINGKLDERDRKKAVSQIQKKSVPENIEMKQNKTENQFISDIAWNKLYNKIENAGLLTEKEINSGFKFNIRNIAASVILLIGLSVGLYYGFSEKIISVTAVTQIKNVILPDGSQISLNVGSEIEYPERFKKNNRKVKFSGEGFFNITKNSKKPFIIKTGDSEIKVVGTSFNVNTKNKKTEVIVTTGRVELKTEKQKIVLNPGEKGISAKGILQKNINKNLNYLSWKTSIFTYENEKLKNIVSDINNVYNVNIVFKTNAVGELVAGSMSFNKNTDNIGTLINVLCNTHHLKAEKKGRKIILSEIDL